jgi:NTE family protein
MGYSPDDIAAVLKSEDFKRWSTGELDPEYVYYYRNADPKPIIAELSFNPKQLDSINFRPTFLPTNIVSPRQMNYAFVELFSRANALAKGNFDNLFVPFRCIASDIYRKEAVVFRSGSLGDAVRASMTFPFMYKPIMINNQLLFDGGIFNNFPVDVMRSDFKPDFMLGSAVSNNPPKPDENDIVRQIENMIMSKSDYSIPEAEGVMLNFKLENVNTFDFSKVDQLVKLGYDEVMKRMPEIMQRVQRRVSKEEMVLRRAHFKNQLPALKFKKVYVVGVDSFFSQCLIQFFERGWLRTTQENSGIHVADDGIGIVFINGFQL